MSSYCHLMPTTCVYWLLLADMQKVMMQSMISHLALKCAMCAALSAVLGVTWTLTRSVHYITWTWLPSHHNVCVFLWMSAVLTVGCYFFMTLIRIFVWCSCCQLIHLSVFWHCWFNRRTSVCKSRSPTHITLVFGKLTWNNSGKMSSPSQPQHCCIHSAMKLSVECCLLVLVMPRCYKYTAILPAALFATVS